MPSSRVLLGIYLCGLMSACGTYTSHEDKGEPSIRRTSTFTGKRSQCYGIINGALINDYPEVVLLARQEGDYITSRCTGTFVSDTTVITAAHCVADSETGDILALVEDCAGQQEPLLVESTKVFHHGFSIDDFRAAEENEQASPENELFKLDLAILTFPAGTAPAFRSLATAPVEAGDTVHFIGYGIEYAPDHDQADAEIAFEAIEKREGRNTLTALSMALGASSDNIGILFNRNAALDHDPGTYSNIAQGDSGGPLFVDDQLVGITSTGSIVEIEGETHDVGFFTDLRSPDSQRLLKKAVDAGVSIDGYDAYSDSL